ncbi:MAG: tRNA (adenosine(37)-N6)-threonylcarbamoyltransferase complex dimerization subunit type 1 TsaB [Treponema sp.]|nr:tRNA (adenosine(37)-N6)-threonylcarbamoyltransferase complex dimerization subunit type 1 TsaB [Treponema sp.]
MNILALDTSDQVLSVALATEAGVSCTAIDSGTRHSELLMECAAWLCKNAGIKPSDVGLVVCMKGPGSFTGLRIGFSAAKGISLALNIPLVAVPTLDCLAYPLSIWPGIALPAIDAKKGCFFAALYREGQRLTDFMDASPETIFKEIVHSRLSPQEQVILTGCGAQALYSRLTADFSLAHITVNPESRSGGARELLSIAKNGTLNNSVNSGPLYLRKSDAELNAG